VAQLLIMMTRMGLDQRDMSGASGSASMRLRSFLGGLLVASEWNEGPGENCIGARRAGDDLQTCRPLAGRPRRDQDPRARVSNDNPFSEAQFKTLKYRPAFPARFGSIQDARAHCHVFFPWYNTKQHHSGLGLLTPADVHHGLAEQRVAARASVLAAAHPAHPERFPAGPPQPPALPVEVWINPPKTRATEETRGVATTRGRYP